MAKALDVANFLVRLAAAEDEPDYLTHLRLQKLLYYAQGWSLALRDMPMFSERIEAWVHGPVVPDVYRSLAGSGSDVILADRFPEPPDLTDEEADFIESVWTAYKDFSAVRLRAMTHAEAPWKAARGNRPSEAACQNEITHEAMKAFFTQASES